jgi:hypothetical protein
MTAIRRRISGVLAAASCLAAMTATSQPPSGDGPRYENGTDLVRPTDYRSWPFIGAGLGMTYDGERGTQAASPDSPRFTHAFVNPTSYAHFMRTGSWPDGTVFMLEFRASQTEGSINRAGRFATQLTFLEAEVKDARFPDGWAFYRFGQGAGLAPVAKPLAGADAAPCVECHSEHAAVERTFVQFYPHLLEVAREKGTLKPGH